MSRAPRTAALGIALCLHCAHAVADRAIEPPIADNVIQQRIAQVIDAIVAVNRGQASEEVKGSVDALQAALGGDREALLRQIVFYRAATPGNEPAMASALLVEFLDFTTRETIAASMPLLDAADARVLASTRELLSTVDRPAGAAPDFSVYDGELRGDEQAAGGLIRYLYSVSPAEALASTLRATGGESLDAESAAHVQALEQLRPTEDDGVIADVARARDAIAILARHDSWPVRLYAAYWIGRDTELASLETLSQLRSDSHALVRDAIER